MGSMTVASLKRTKIDGMTALKMCMREIVDRLQHTFFIIDDLMTL